jgi:MerR family transcriptional regulator, light-induced transcriptional regulator
MPKRTQNNSSTPQAQATVTTATTPQPQYRIGVAARLAGIPVETLRVWERRYQVGGSNQSDRGRRSYSAESIERLRLVKQLVDAGNPAGSVAGLPMSELLAVRAATTGLTVPAGDALPLTSSLRIALIGTSSRLRWQAQFAVVGDCADPGKAAKELHDVQADIVVFELQSLSGLKREHIEGVKRVTDARAVIVLYRFAPSETIRKLREAGYVVAHANLDATEIELLCRTALSGHQQRTTVTAPPPPAARFDAAALETLANTKSAIHCECPRHLAEILLDLGSFERYSGECSSRSPADAELHRNLQRAAGQARALLEDAMLQLVLAEGLPLPKVVAAR